MLMIDSNYMVGIAISLGFAVCLAIGILINQYVNNKNAKA